jgi:PAS domain S-box-containing protein
MTSPVVSEAQQLGNWFELIVEGAPDAILMVDQLRRITLVNRSTENLFGYLRAELIGQPLEILVPKRYRDRPPALIASVLTEPKARSIGTGRDLLGLRKDGTEVPIEIGLNPIETPSGLYIVVSIIDITERTRAEIVQQSMAALVESADDAILTKDLDGNIRSWNPGAERLLGYRALEIIGQPITRLLPDDRQDEETMILDRIRNGKPVAHFETVRRRSNGSLVDVSLTISPIRDRTGAVVGASKIMRNITERIHAEVELRRANQQLEEINEELDNFVYTASHDLRAPLNGVSTVAQWILEDDRSLTAETRDRLVLIQGRIDRMKRLLNDIRDYARAGRFAQISGEPLTAAALVTDVMATVHVPSGFSIRCDPSLEAAHVTRVPLEQVLHNLIGNAIKHHDCTTGIVTISVQPSIPYLRFSVMDDGPGISEEYRSSVFEMFKTLKPRDEVEGSGIGLALVRKIVERMGGRCGITTAPVRGAHFWFDWPQFEQPQAAAK